MPAFLTSNDRDFTLVSAPPSNIRQLIWQGLPGVYLAAAEGGLYKTVDYGATWGVLRPNTEFGSSAQVNGVPWDWETESIWAAIGLKLSTI